jgi:hypothetical protein
LEEAWWSLTDDERDEYMKKGGAEDKKDGGKGNGNGKNKEKMVDGSKSVEKSEDGTLIVNSGADAAHLGTTSRSIDDGTETPPDGPTHGRGGVMMEKTDSDVEGLASKSIGSGKLGKKRAMVLEDLETVRGVPVSQVS